MDMDKTLAVGKCFRNLLNKSRVVWQITGIGETHLIYKIIIDQYGNAAKQPQIESFCTIQPLLGENYEILESPRYVSGWYCVYDDTQQKRLHFSPIFEDKTLVEDWLADRSSRADLELIEILPISYTELP